MGTTVDWNRWLPWRKIRDWGFIELKVGQVWAWRDDFGSVVFRVTKEHPEQDAFDAESLASNGLPGHMDTRHVYGVLVQDVGQPEPTPPDSLWQDAYALPPDICYADAGASVRKAFSESFNLAPPPLDRRTRLKVGDVAMVGSDGEIVRTPCTGQPGCKCGRQPVGKIVAKKGDHVIVAIGAGDFEFKVAADLALGELPDYTPAEPVTFADPEGAFAPGTFSNLLAPMKPLTADSILEAMKSMDAIKTRDAETKKRYDDMMMSGFTAPMKLPPWDSFGSYRYHPMLDDRPRDHATVKPRLTEAEITRLQWAADDGGRYEPELFPEVPEFYAPRTQSQSIAAGLGVWSTRGDAELPPDPKPYPHVSDEDLLPDA